MCRKGPLRPIEGHLRPTEGHQAWVPQTDIRLYQVDREYSQANINIEHRAVRPTKGLFKPTPDHPTGADPGKLQGEGHESRWCPYLYPK